MSKFNAGFTSLKRLKPPINLSPIMYRYPMKLVGMTFEDAQEIYAKHDIAVRKGVDSLLHRQQGQPDSLFPNAITLYNTTLSIPFYPKLSDSEVDKIIDVTQKCF